MGDHSRELDVLAQGSLMRIFCFFLLFIFQVSHVSGVTDIFLQMKPDQKYMSFVLDKYLRWHDQYFPGRYAEMNKLTDGKIKEFISKLDHWIVPGHPELPQFSIGHRAQGPNEIFLTYRVYIAPSLRNDSFLQNRLPEGQRTPWFLEWRSDLSVCLLTLNEKLRPIGFDVYCGNDGDKKLKLIGKEILTEESFTPWPNPFPYLLGREVRRYEGEKLVQIRYFSDATHPSRSDRRLDHVIHLHGMEALFPFDKFGVGEGGEITVYYP